MLIVLRPLFPSDSACSSTTLTLLLGRIRGRGPGLTPPAPRRRPAAPGSAALAIATSSMVATRRARLRRACDRHGC
ncbi:hypothetical protein CE197_07735 [Mycobacterium intracellulare subsp. chimaera]|nr:hypothetical protein CE197_07735 [Mycobacterium intracellulare subsp. chimaera]